MTNLKVQHNNIEYNIDLPEIVSSEEALTMEVEDKLMVAYLTLDNDALNPLEEFDANGNIFTSHRNAGRSEIANYGKYMGMGEDHNKWGKFNPENLAINAIPLDVYQHTGVTYSVSGEGQQDRFDTAKNCAVWVADQSVMDNIEAQLVDFYIKNLNLNSRLVEILRGKIKADKDSEPDCRNTSENNVLFVRLANHLDCRVDGILHKKQELLREYCKSVLTEYNHYLNGEVYSVNFNEYEISRTKSGKVSLVLTDENAISGFYGEEYAIQELKNQFDYSANVLKAKIAEQEAVQENQSEFKM